MRRFRQSSSAVVGLILCLLLLVAAVVGIWYTPYNPIEIAPSVRLQPPSGAHWMGTDHFGRDIFSRVLAGAHLSLAIGLASILVAVLAGLVLGLPAGYFGGQVDMVIMRLIDILLAFPSVLLALSIVALLGPSLANVVLAVGIATIPVFTRMVRAAVMSVRELPYIESARAIGGTDARLIGTHILPNIVAPLIVLATLNTASAILIGSALSFLGLGPQPPSPEWGAILSEARNYMRLGWWLTVFPGSAIALAVLALNLLGDGLRDVLDPQMKS